MSETPFPIDASFSPESKDRVDALRIEVSSLSPSEERKLRTEVALCNTVLKSHYGRFMAKNYEDSEIAQRFLLSDEPTVRNFIEVWGGEDSSTSYLPEGEIGYMTAYKGADEEFVFGSTSDSWRKLGDGEQQRLIAAHGSADKAASYVNSLYRRAGLAHELCHMYQDEDLPVAFLECGAHFYGVRVSLLSKKDYIADENTDRVVDFYKGLIEKYGDDVHRVFFGAAADKEKREQILQEFTEDVQRRLFPELKVSDSGESTS